MHYAVTRRKIRVVLLFILLSTAILLVGPWVYERVFIQDEDFDVDGATYPTSPRPDEYVVPDAVGGTAEIDFLNSGYVFSKFKIEDLEIKNRVISGDIIAKGRIIEDEDGRGIGFSGKIFSKNVTLDEIPFLPLKMSFEIKEDVLEIKALHLGKSYKLNGKIDLRDPFRVDLHLEIIRADMRRISKIAKIKGHSIVLGIVSGVFDVEGDLGGNLFSKGIVESRNGKIGSVGYNLVTLKLEGFGPVINIVDSNVQQDSGTLTMEGYIDLRNIAKGGLLDGLRIKSDMKTIVWDGWDISKDGTDELTMSKDISEKMRVGFKTMHREPLTTYYDRESPEEMSLEYKVGLENLKMKLKKDEEFFGIEHSVEF